MTLSQFIERNPHAGIFASIAGFTGSFISFLQQASVVIGFIGAVFGLLAGVYTFRIKRRHWLTILDKEKQTPSK
jgi:hypothetical protein